MIGYLEPHDRPETAALAEGLEVVPRLRVEPRRRSSSRRWTSTPSSGARPSSRSSTSSPTRTRPASRNAKRYQDIDEILDAGIDVISTVNVQHLESLNDAVFELTGVRVRETFPDRVLDEADEVVLVDLSPEALQERLRAGKVYPRRAGRARRSQNFFRHDNLAALRELALREVAEDVEARRHAAVLDPLSQQAVAERVLALVEPQPRSQRILRRAWRSAQRLGAEIDALWMRRPGSELVRRTSATQLAALRRLAVDPRRPLPRGGGRRPRRRRCGGSPRERGSTYIFVGTPDERRRAEILRGSLRLALVRELPGIDIRVVADRALRDGGSDAMRLCRARQPRRASRTRATPQRASSFRSRRRSSTRPCSTPRSGSRAPRTRCSCPPTCIFVPLEFGLDAPVQQTRSSARCRCSRRSSTRPAGPASPSTRGSSAAARRSTRSSGSGTRRRSTVIVPAPAPGTRASRRRISPGCSRTRPPRR